MRILGFSKKWDKLKQDEFTTFRFPRRDRDWAVGEAVQIVYKPRSKEREILGSAEIIGKESRQMVQHHAMLNVSEEEFKEDGFDSGDAMEGWLIKVYGLKRLFEEPMNKLTLRWVSGNG